jgi:hypothetical protein
MMQVMASGQIKGYRELRQVVKNSFECRTFDPMDVQEWNDQYYRYLKIIDNRKNEK